MRLPFAVIDADGHVLEHAVDWAARLPARFGKDAPGWVTLPDGDRHFMVERKTWPTRRDFYGARACSRFDRPGRLRSRGTGGAGLCHRVRCRRRPA